MCWYSYQIGERRGFLWFSLAFVRFSDGSMTGAASREHARTTRTHESSRRYFLLFFWCVCACRKIQTLMYKKYHDGRRARNSKIRVVMSPKKKNSSSSSSSSSGPPRAAPFSFIHSYTSSVPATGYQGRPRAFIRLIRSTVQSRSFHSLHRPITFV